MAPPYDSCEAAWQHPVVRTGRVQPIAWGGFLLLGWSGLLVPSLVRQIEADFGVDDAAIGVWYFVAASAYAVGSLGGGLLTERFGRRVVLTAAALSVAASWFLAGASGASGSWALFTLAAVVGGGAGAIDGGMNGLVLAVTESASGRALNLLHLFFSIGALAAPLAIGWLVAAGVPWQLPMLATGVAGLVVAAAVAAVAMPSGRHVRPADPSPALPPRAGTRFSLPLLLLAIAIGCYVAAEIAVSSWTVRFLDDVPFETATLALSGFWAGLALGRLLAARWGHRFSHSGLASTSVAAAGIAVIVAVLAPSPTIAIGGIAVAGFASGPVFPLIVAIGGDLYPHRVAAVAGALTAAAVVGGIVYPPLVGILSASIGLGAGLLGGACLSIVAAVAILAAARLSPAAGPAAPVSPPAPPRPA
jgi:fucose permease